MSAYCSGKAGANSVAFVRPSGMIRARYSPEPLSLKLVWSGRPGTRRFLFEAKTTRKLFGPRLVAGKAHCVRFVDLFDKNQPPKFTLFVPALYSSIQSE